MDDINAKEKGILERQDKAINENKQYLEKVAKEFRYERVEMSDRIEKKLLKVKQVISTYFEKYDVDLEDLKINIKTLNQKYSDWTKALIEPSSLNEARLFSLETRVHEEEEIRIKEYDYLRELFKKLVFSLEQTNL
jgi:hypothetical protein